MTVITFPLYGRVSMPSRLELTEAEMWEVVWQKRAYKPVPYEQGEICEKCWLVFGVTIAYSQCIHGRRLRDGLFNFCA